MCLDWASCLSGSLGVNRNPGGCLIQPVIFDFDFTLADSSAGAIECVGYALVKMGFPRPDPSEIQETIGLSLHESLVLLVGRLEESEVGRYRRAFVERADQVMAPLTQVYDYVPGVLSELRSSGCQLAIVSTKFRYRIESILAREGLADFFDTIVGGEDTPKHKPDPTGLLLALERLEVGRSQALYVGDHPVDGRAARAAAIPFVATLSGVSKLEDFAEFDPLAIIADLSELPSVLRTLKA